MDRRSYSVIMSTGQIFLKSHHDILSFGPILPALGPMRSFGLKTSCIDTCSPSATVYARVELPEILKLDCLYQ
jgi:hypothetical protein